MLHLRGTTRPTSRFRRTRFPPLGPTPPGSTDSPRSSRTPSGGNGISSPASSTARSSRCAVPDPTTGSNGRLTPSHSVRRPLLDEFVERDYGGRVEMEDVAHVHLAGGGAGP